MNFTKLEKKLMKTIKANMEDDGFCNEDIQMNMHINMNTYRGIIGSLKKKGIITFYGYEDCYNDAGLTPKGEEIIKNL